MVRDMISYVIIITIRLSRCCQPPAADADPDDIQTEKRVKLKVLECGLSCLYYNPGLVLQVTSSTSHCQPSITPVI